MKISKPAQRDARQLFRSCQVNGLLDENRVRQAVSLLVTQKPRGYVGILSRLQRLVKLDIEQHASDHAKKVSQLLDLIASAHDKPASVYQSPWIGKVVEAGAEAPF